MGRPIGQNNGKAGQGCRELEPDPAGAGTDGCGGDMGAGQGMGSPGRGQGQPGPLLPPMALAGSSASLNILKGFTEL